MHEMATRQRASGAPTERLPRRRVTGDFEVHFGEASFALGGKHPAVDLDVAFKMTGALEGRLGVRLRIQAPADTADPARIGAFTAAATFSGKLVLGERELTGTFRGAFLGRVEPTGCVSGRIAIEHATGALRGLNGTVDLRRGGQCDSGTYEGHVWRG